jgi:hypothetical protein
MPVRLNGSTSGYSELSAPAVAANNTLTLPTSNGTSRQTLMGDGAGALSFSWDAGSFYYRLNADLAGANVNTAQSVFGVGVTLASSTVYAFDAIYLFLKTAGATSHTIGLGYAGTATLNNIVWRGEGMADNNAIPLARINTTSSLFASNSAANLVVTDARANAAQSGIFRVTGTVSINAGGTFIPQYTLSAAPGGAYSTMAGSFIKFTPIGASGSASSQGTWS